jgi:hypothetical protein
MWKALKSNLSELSRDDLLDAIGLEARRSAAEKMVPTLAVFGAGVLVGVGLGLLLAPKPGRELRADVRQRFRKGEGETESDAAPASAAAKV